MRKLNYSNYIEVVPRRRCATTSSDFRSSVCFASRFSAMLPRQDSNPHRHLREVLSTLRLSAGRDIWMYCLSEGSMNPRLCKCDGFTVIVHCWGQLLYNYLCFSEKRGCYCSQAMTFIWQCLQSKSNRKRRPSDKRRNRGSRHGAFFPFLKQ